MTQKEFAQAAVAYRKYRERCGVKDPVMLDEIEEAYFKGAVDTFALYSIESSESIEDAMIREYSENNPTYIYGLYGTAKKED